MFCQNCGSQVESGQKNCPNCGAPIENAAPPNPNGGQPFTQYEPPRSAYQQYDNSYEAQNKPDNDTGAAGFGILGFFFPLIGLILYLVWKNDYPKRSKASGKGALIGVIIYVIMIIIYIIIFVSILNRATSEIYSAFNLLSIFG